MLFRSVDYGHGTGHGVGSFLSVHEGPQRISKPGGAFPGTETPLREGMILSNEPGYYKPGEYGIRIENLQYVTPPTDIPGGERKMLGFRNLTWAPLARDLIVLDRLSPAEHDGVNAYHAEVLEKIGPLVDGEAGDWLQAACAPV